MKIDISKLTSEEVLSLADKGYSSCTFCSELVLMEELEELELEKTKESDS